MGKIVIIEETGMLRIRMDKFLRKMGYLDIEFTSIDSLIQLKSILKDVSLLIIDLDDRKMDKTKMIQIIQKYIGKIGISILLLSKETDITQLKIAISLGCSEFLLKPYDDLTFGLKINKVMETNKDVVALKDVSSEYMPLESIMHWNEEYKVGVELIDNDHKAIIEKFKALYELMKKGMGHEYYKELLLFLEDYVNRHFDNEETFQKSKGFVNYLEHKQKHEDFRKKIKQLTASHQNHSVTNDDLIQLNMYIKDWLIHHILIEDRKMAEIIKDTSQV